MINVSISRLIKSFQYAVRGLVKVFREEQNLRVQTIVAIFVLLLSWNFNLNHIELSIIFIVIAIVILMEILNSAVERISDVLKPRIDNYVKEIKDVMAAAVMSASILAIIVGIIIFWPHLFN